MNTNQSQEDKLKQAATDTYEAFLAATSAANFAIGTVRSLADKIVGCNAAEDAAAFIALEDAVAAAKRANLAMWAADAAADAACKDLAKFLGTYD